MAQTLKAAYPLLFTEGIPLPALHVEAISALADMAASQGKVIASMPTIHFLTAEQLVTAEAEVKDMPEAGLGTPIEVEVSCCPSCGADLIKKVD